MLFGLFIAAFFAAAAARPDVCHPHVGCFNMDPPWLTPDRPVPAPISPNKMKARVFFYSRPRTNRQHIIQTWPTIEMRDAPFDSRKFTFFLTHGLETQGNEKWLMQIKDLALKKYDCNFFIGDWGKGAKGTNYFQAVGNLRLAAREFSNMLQYLVDHRGLNVTRFNCMGHSLGSQVCGQIAKSIPGVFQVTAMDPSQPCFEKLGPVVQLQESDAVFVLAIHADARPFIPDLGFGHMNPVGDVDLYFNAGHGQPGCNFPKVVEIPKIQSLGDFVAVPAQIFEQTLLCPHGLSHAFMAEAMADDNCTFWGHNATMKNMLRGISNGATQGFFSKFLGLSEPCTMESCAPLSINTYFWPARGVFVVTTRGSPPYCIYEAGLISENVQRDFYYKFQKAAIGFLEPLGSNGAGPTSRNNAP